MNYDWFIINDWLFKIFPKLRDKISQSLTNATLWCKLLKSKLHSTGGVLLHLWYLFTLATCYKQISANTKFQAKVAMESTLDQLRKEVEHFKEKCSDPQTELMHDRETLMTKVREMKELIKTKGELKETLHRQSEWWKRDELTSKCRDYGWDLILRAVSLWTHWLTN